MRFDKLNIPAFGPFTNFSLEFKKSANDIHLIYGANEAGKSSLLRAIHQMLYGIPTRSDDNFIHPNAKLLVGARVSNSNSSLNFVRKKGRNNTLLDSALSSIEDNALKPYLGSVDDEFFSHMFGLNTEKLREGASKLLSGEGNLGTLLFSASLGGSPIDDAIAKLEAEATSLYKDRTKKGVSILPALDQYKENEKLAKQSSINPADHTRLEKELALALAEFEQVDQIYSNHSERLRFVTNCLRAYPIIQSLRQTELELEDIKTPKLASDFVSRLRQQEASLREAKQAVELIQQQHTKALTDLSQQTSDNEILEYSAEIEALSRGLDSYNFRVEDQQLAKEELANLEMQLKQQLTELGLTSETDLQGLHSPTISELAQVKDKAEKLETLAQTQSSLNQQIEKLKRQIASSQQELQQISHTTDLPSLELISEKADKHHSQASLIERAKQELKLSKQQSLQLSHRLQLSHQDSTQSHTFASLNVPSEASIRNELEKESDLLEQLKQKKNQILQLTEERTTELHQLNLLKKKTAIYSHQDLETTRQLRDENLKSIASQPDVVPDSEFSILADLIAKADTIADALHSNAGVMSAAESHQAKIELYDLKLTDADRFAQEIEQAHVAWKEQWAIICESIPTVVKSPTDLLQWRELWLELCKHEASTLSITQQVTSFDENQVALETELKAALSEASNTADFISLHQQIKKLIKQANQQQGSIEQTQKQLGKATIELEQLQLSQTELIKDIERASEAWRKIASELQLPDHLTASSCMEIIRSRQTSKQLLVQKEQLKNKISEGAKSMQDYLSQLQTTSSETLSANEQSLPASSIVSLLNKYHDEAIKSKTKLDLITEKIDDLSNQLDEKQLLFKQAQSSLDDFYSLAEVANQEELETLIIEIETKQKLTHKIEQARDKVQLLAGQSSLAEFTALVEAEDREQLGIEEAELTTSGQTKLATRDEAKALLDSLKMELEKLKCADDTAAHYKQAAAFSLSTIVSDTERFIKLQYAIDFLKQQVEAYREKTQGPMIDKTSAFFRELTSESFSGVAAQLDDKGEPQLVALRSPNNEQVSTSGLSEGTADQLYLALRLAAIDLHLENHPAIPLILDDLLMTFDDERTKALIPVLLKLSKKAQILIFTHHKHLLELVKDQLNIYQLEAS